jgi:hypothetical protein
MKRAFYFCLCLSVQFGHSSALAFSLADHEAITREAAREYSLCFPNSLSTLQIIAINEANLGEDANLFRKWLRYSHFFHPEKKLEMLRLGSFERISSLEETVESKLVAEDEFNSSLGHLIHHLQDSASPPHVVPVNHWLTDGFETFEPGKVPVQNPTREICQKVAQGLFENPKDILLRTAQETLTRARSSVPGFRNGRSVMIPWSYFWTESRDTGFGAYGLFENRFGIEKLEVSQDVYLIPLEAYRSFKNQQLSLAVQVTLKALAWAQGVRLQR